MLAGIEATLAQRGSKAANIFGQQCWLLLTSNTMLEPFALMPSVAREENSERIGKVGRSIPSLFLYFR